MALRTRIRNAIIVVAMLALLLYGIPLAIVLDRLITSQALTGLQRDATLAVASVPDNVLEAGAHLNVPSGTGDVTIGVYDVHGSLVAGIGPKRSVLAAQAADGHEHNGHDNNDLSVVIPVLSDTAVAGSVRAATPVDQLRAQVYRSWGLLAVLALVIIGVAVLLARRAARRISGPFEQLTAAARHLGGGQYEVHLPVWGIPEADAAGDALRESAREIDTLIHQEREFVRHASHQLRTPLTALLLHLQRQPPDVDAALARARHLETTIADLLALRGPTVTGACDPRQVAAEAVQRWSTPQRPIILRADDIGEVGLPAPALRQSLDVLLDNAMRHGSGPITVTVEPYGEAVLLEVADQGPGFAPTTAPGTGLRLATSIVERAGGSMLIRRKSPHPRVALLLPPPAQSTSNRYP